MEKMQGYAPNVPDNVKAHALMAFLFRDYCQWCTRISHWHDFLAECRALHLKEEKLNMNYGIYIAGGGKDAGKTTLSLGLVSYFKEHFPGQCSIYKTAWAEINNS